MTTGQKFTQHGSSGHGHVFPTPDGSRARCGGPAICRACAADLAALEQAKQYGEGVLQHQYTDPHSVTATLVEAMKGQLLLVLVNRLGGKVEIPVWEVDGTGGWMMSMQVDQHRGVFVFETSKKS